jgi:cell division inhibitor SulA
MPDDLRKSGPQDGWRISLHQEHELDYWTKALRVTRDELRTIVGKVGNLAKDVRAEIVERNRVADVVKAVMRPEPEHDDGA